MSFPFDVSAGASSVERSEKLKQAASPSQNEEENQAISVGLNLATGPGVKFSGSGALPQVTGGCGIKYSGLHCAGEKRDRLYKRPARLF
jgi:hypothetical protein